MVKTIQLAGISVLGGLLAVGIYHAITTKSDIPPDSYSVNRMTRLSQVLTSYFGPKWPTVFAIFGLLLTVILVQLYFFTITVNMSDQNFNKLQKYMFWFAIVFTVAMFLLAYKRYREEQEKNQVVEGDFSDQTKVKELAKELAEMIGLGALVVVVLGIVVRMVVK